MNQTIISEEAMREAVNTAHDKWLQSLPEPDECDHEYPEGFYGSLLRYANKQKHLKTIGRSVAAAIIALLTAGAILLTASPAARAAVISWVRELIGSNIVYQFKDSSSLTEIPNYTLSYIPEGFEEADGLVTPTKRSVFYLNPATDENFAFECLLLLEGNHIELLTAGSSTHEIVTVNGIEADFYYADESSSSNNLIWFDESKRIAFGIHSNLDQSVMLHIAEGIVLEDSIK